MLSAAVKLVSMAEKVGNYTYSNIAGDDAVAMRESRHQHSYPEMCDTSHEIIAANIH
jgi:hypothetical protein